MVIIPRYGPVRVVPRPRYGLIRDVHVDVKIPFISRAYVIFATKDEANTLLRSSIWLYLKSILSTRSKCFDLNVHLEPTIDGDS